MSYSPTPPRRRRLKIVGGTGWETGSGGVYTEPVAFDGDTATLTVTMPAKYYKLLRALQADPASYLSKLIASHCEGLIKSSHHNNRR